MCYVILHRPLVNKKFHLLWSVFMRLLYKARNPLSTFMRGIHSGYMKEVATLIFMRCYMLSGLCHSQASFLGSRLL